MSGSGKSDPKSPRFFCESCGAEVPRNAKTCPQCGRYFASVLCPSCGFSGEESLFKGGCPVCGYSTGKGRGDLPGFPEGKKPAGPLPLWVYILTVAVFTAVLAALLFKFMK